MKKKLQQLMQDSRLAGNAEWTNLQKSLQLAKKKYEKAKTDKEKAKTAWKEAGETEGKKDADQSMLLYTRFHQAKAMHHFHKLAYKLVEYQQKRWLESYAQSQADQPALLMIDPKKMSRKKATESPKRAKSVSKSTKKSSKSAV
ncbi:MAG TPA: hypothetical protein VK168_07015 [Saprospiraceae bacterium]|nr:hypothetical protein [Saprospiraceae bacterium]